MEVHPNKSNTYSCTVHIDFFFLTSTLLHFASLLIINNLRVFFFFLELDTFYCTDVLLGHSFVASHADLSHDEIRGPFFPDELDNRRARLLLELQQLWLNISLQVPVGLLGCQGENILYSVKQIAMSQWG